MVEIFFEKKRKAFFLLLSMNVCFAQGCISAENNSNFSEENNVFYSPSINSSAENVDLEKLEEMKNSLLGKQESGQFTDIDMESYCSILDNTSVSKEWKDTIIKIFKKNEEETVIKDNIKILSYIEALRIREKQDRKKKRKELESYKNKQILTENKISYEAVELEKLEEMKNFLLDKQKSGKYTDIDMKSYCNILDNPLVSRKWKDSIIKIFKKNKEATGIKDNVKILQYIDDLKIRKKEERKKRHQEIQSFQNEETQDLVLSDNKILIKFLSSLEKKDRITFIDYFPQDIGPYIENY